MEELPPGFLSLGLGHAPVPTPMAPARAPPALLDEIVEEIFLRVPPDDPARLVRAALVCKHWAGGPASSPTAASAAGTASATGRRGRPRCWASSPTSPTWEAPRASSPRWPSAPPAPTAATTARTTPATTASPSTGSRGAVAAWPRRRTTRSRSGTQSPTSTGPCRSSCVPSRCGAGTPPCSAPPPAATTSTAAPATSSSPSSASTPRSGLVPLKYDLATRKMSVISVPQRPYARRFGLMTMEDGELGFAEVDSGVYSQALVNGDAGKWAVIRSMELSALLPPPALGGVVAFADIVGVIFLKTTDGLDTFDLKTGQSICVMTDDFYDIIPYVSFYTPVLRVATIGEGQSEGASTA